MSEAAFTVLPLTPLRRAIAARMTEAKQTIPHFRLTIGIDVDAMLAQRKRLRSAQPESQVTVNDCLIKACATALMKHPSINSQLVDDHLHQYHQADISVVVSIEGGLSTPVVRAADRKSVQDIAAEVAALKARAAQGQLKMSELLGGSFTISNLGAYGIEQFDAIINPPQCAILAIGRAVPRMIIDDGGGPRIATVLQATLSVDHRAVDGTDAADFLMSLRQIVEQPEQLF